MPWQPSLGQKNKQKKCSDFTSVQDIEKFYRVNSRFSAWANSNVLSDFSREQRELPRQPNLGKYKAKVHRFQLCTRYRDIFRVNNSVFGVCEFKYAIRISRDQTELLWQPNLGKKQPKKIVIKLRY